MATWRGFVYAAFVIDVFSRRIVGWRASTIAQSDSPTGWCISTGDSDDKALAETVIALFKT